MHQSTLTELNAKVKGVIFGGAIGDALGGPVENMHYRFIRKLHNGKVSDMISYTTRPSDFHQAGEGRGAYAWSDKAGTYTDDTRLANLISAAIVEKKGRITADDLARTWMKDMAVETFWHSISNSYFRIAVSRTPVREAGAGNIPDNSSAMCIGPVGAINFGNPAQAALDAYDVASLSHDGYSREAASIIAAAVAEACKPSTSVKAVVEAAINYLPNKDTSPMYEKMMVALELADKAKDTEELTEMYYRDLIVPWIRRGGRYPEDNERISLSVDPRESVPCAIAMFYKNEGNYPNSVLSAVNFGRDCDTIACMTGYIAGAYNGIEGIPEKWVMMVKEANPDPDLEQLSVGIVEALIIEKTRMQMQIDLMREST